MKTKESIIKNDEDELVFIVLKRTIKEFGYKIKNDVIVQKCYHSRLFYSEEGSGSESKYYNISIWPHDLGINDSQIVKIVFISRFILLKKFNLSCADYEFVSQATNVFESLLYEISCIIKKYGKGVIYAIDKLLKIKDDKRLTNNDRKSLSTIKEKLKGYKLKENSFIIYD